MSNPADRVEIITSVQRRRRWAAAEKVRMVEETFEPGMTVSLVARRHGVAPNQLFTWRRLVVEGALTAAGSGEQVVPASDYRALLPWTFPAKESVCGFNLLRGARRDASAGHFMK